VLQAAALKSRHAIHVHQQLQAAVLKWQLQAADLAAARKSLLAILVPLQAAIVVAD